MGKRAYCHECRRQRLFVRCERDMTATHVINGLLCFVTCGFWLPVYIIILLCQTYKYMCKDCGEML
jgi:hypothetical protein